MIMDFWKRFDEQRKQLELGTVQQIADRLDIPRGSLNNWRRDKRYPDAESLLKMANYLNVSIEWLMTGTEIELLDEETEKGTERLDLPVVITPSGREICPKAEEPTVLIPIYTQKLSAGRGEDFLNENDIVGYVRILTKMLRGLDPSTVGAAEVKGDSMIGVQIFGGDLVIFAQGVVEENGLYVVALDESVLVKRLEFNPIDKTISIISENKNYKPLEVPSSNENFMIQGKVLGWIHVHPY